MVSTKRIRGSPEIIWGTAGASRGRATAASFTIARVRGQTGVPGVKEKNWFGGTRKNGPVLMLPDLFKENLLTTNLR